MVGAERRRVPGFSLRLEQGLGRLVLNERRVAELVTVEELQLSLAQVPSRLDMSAGVERFRHHRARLEKLQVNVPDHLLGRALRAAARDVPLLDLEVRADDGDLVVVGEVEGPPNAPFIARARLEPASVAGERAMLVSFYELRVFGAARLAAPQIAMALLDAFGLAEERVGATAAVVDPIDRLLLEIFAELGWKLPNRSEARLDAVQSTGGRLSLAASRHALGRAGLRSVEPPTFDASARTRRFLADYEAKSLYAALEQAIAEGAIDRAATGYERQLELHAEHPFVLGRALQLLAARHETAGEALALARGRLSRYPDDVEALTALGSVQSLRGDLSSAAGTFARIAELAGKRGDPVEAAQAHCAVAQMLAEREPAAAIRALNEALALRRRLPGALRALAELHGRVGDWGAALRARERLLAGETDAGVRLQLLLELGTMALERAGDLEAARVYFERALDASPEQVPALLGLAGAQEALGRPLPAIRSLDRAAQMLEARGDASGAASVMVRLGDLWRRMPEDGGATAALRYRQALMLEPAQPGALLGLAECAAEEGEPVRARAHLEELLRATAGQELEGSGVDRAGVYLRLGRLLSGPLNDKSLAITWFQKALSGRPAQVEAALEALIELHGRAQRFEDLARVLEVAVERAEDPLEQAHRMMRLAEVARERLQDPWRAAGLLEEAATLAPADLRVLQARVEAWRNVEDPARLSLALEALAQQHPEPKALAEIYAERGLLLRVHLNRADEAVECFGLALGCDPEHLGALAGLADLYRERERHSELAGLLARLALLEPERDRAGRVLLELGRLQADVLERPEAARESFTAALERMPEDVEALRRCGDALYDAEAPEEALVHYQRLYAIYEEQGYDEAPAPFLLRLGACYDAAEQTEQALEALQRAAEESPDERSIYEQAQDVLLRSGDVEAIVRVFTEGLERARRPGTRAFLARRAGRLLWRELRRPEEAAPLLDTALQLEPRDVVRRMRLEVATALADWPTVADLLKAQLQAARPEERPALLTSLAKLAYGDLGRPEEGTELALAALTERPDYAPALTLLGERSYAASDWPNARQAYGRLVDLEGQERRPEDLLRLGVCELHTGEPEAARDRLRALYAGGHQLPELAATLAEACLQLEDAGGLASVLEARLEAFIEDAERLRFLRRAGALLTESPGQRAAGLSCWRAILKIDGEDAQALEALRAAGAVHEEAVSSAPPAPKPAPEASSSEASMADLPSVEVAPDEGEAAALEAAAHAATDPDVKAAAWLAVAEHRRDRLYDPRGAEPAFTLVLEVATPASPEWTEAMEALEDLYAVRADWDALLGLYERRLIAGVGEPAEVHLLSASILRAADRIDEAIQAAERALPVGERATDLLVGLLEEAGRPHDAAEYLLQGLGRLSAEDAGHRRWRAADLVSETDPARALFLLAAAYGSLQESMVLEEWIILARRLGDGPALARALEARAETLPDDAGGKVRRSSLLLEAAGGARAADRRRLLEAAWRAWPDNVDAMMQLSDVLSPEAEGELLRELLRAVVAASLPGEHRGLMAQRLAGLEREAGDEVQAAHYEAMAREDLGAEPEAPPVPETPAPEEDAEDTDETSEERPATERLPGPDPFHVESSSEEGGAGAPDLSTVAANARAVAARGRSQDLQAMQLELANLAQDAEEPDRKAALLSLRGELLRTRMGHTEEAAEDLRRARELAPDLPQPALALGLMASNRLDSETALLELEAALSQADASLGPLSDREQRAAFSALARALERLGRTTELADTARRILDARPDCLPVLRALDRAIGDKPELLRRHEAAIEAHRDPPSILTARFKALRRAVERDIGQ